MPARRPRQFSILIVDDDEDLAASLGQVLQEGLGNLKIRVAASGQQGLQLLEKARVDLVISDFQLPGITGFEFLNLVARKDPGIQRILVTGFPERRLALAALQENQAVHFFRKPIDANEVIQVVGDIIGGRFTPRRRAQAFRRSMELAQPAWRG